MRPVALLLSLAILSPATAQIVEVPNTGCPGATHAAHTGSPRLGQQVQFSWSCKKTSQIVLAFLGSASGGGIALDQPVTCDPGPCIWYPGPLGSSIIQLPGEVSYTLQIPNDARLVGLQLGLQCVCWCG
jgi:hypothetical protein